MLRSLFGVVAVAGGILTSAACPAADPRTPTDLKPKVERLIEQLGTPDKQVAAETELLKLGPDILPLLPSPEAKLSADQQKRLKSIRTALTEAQVLRDLAPHTVTLRKKAIKLSEALEEIQKQTGMTVANRCENGGGDQAFALDLQKATFWQALDTLAKEADLQLSLYEKDGVPALRDGPHRTMPVSYSGMFRVAVKRLVSVRDLESDNHTCTVQLEVAWEPRFRPLFMQNKPDALVVQDDKGVALTVGEAGEGRTPITKKLTAEMQVALKAPRRNVAQLGLLKGSLTIVGPSKMLDFTFDKLARVDKGTAQEKVPSQTREGVTVRLREFLNDNDLWTFGFLLEYPGAGADFESFESWLVNNEIFLVNKAGKRFGPANYELTEQESKALATYRFAEEKGLVFGKLDKWKIIYRTPGPIARVPFHFEFKDIPLP